MSIDNSTLNVLLGWGMTAIVGLQAFMLKKLHELDKRITVLEVYEKAKTKHEDDAVRITYRGGHHTHGHRSDSP